jgi:hypothetical protein
MKQSMNDSDIVIQAEALRKKARPLFVAGIAMLVVSAIIAIIIVIGRETGSFYPEENVPVIVLAAAIGVIGTVLVLTGKHHARKLKGFFGENVIRGCLAEIFDGLDYNHAMHIDKGMIRNAGLVSGWDECYGSDYCTGSYKGVRIQFSDIRLTEIERKKDKDGNTKESETTVFMGQWLICELDKELPARLRLRENTRKVLGGDYQKGKGNLDTENEAFNEKYQIIADDEHTAFYILTPHFMEKIVEMDVKAHGRTFMCFDRNRIHIAINNNRDSFEISTKAGSVNDLNALRDRFRAETEYLTDLLDEILLNTRITGRVE